MYFKVGHFFSLNTTNIVFRCIMEVARVSYISCASHARKLVMIVGVINQNRVLVDGPCTQVMRYRLCLSNACSSLTSSSSSHTAPARNIFCKPGKRQVSVQNGQQ